MPTTAPSTAKIAAIAQREEMWLHVDGAMCGITALAPEYQWVNAGLEHADSYCTNPHKWMGINFDCDLFWTADRQALLGALSILPEYLRSQAAESGAVIDYRDWQVPLGRRFRSLKLWWVLRSYGASGIRHHIREHVRLAHELAERVAAHPLLEPVAPTSFALVCFRHVGGNEATDALAAAVNAEPELRITPSTIGGQRFVRVSVGQSRTGQSHVDRLWEVMARALEDGARG